MIALRSLLSHLTRAEVGEIVLESGRPPSARVEGALDRIDAHVISADELVQLLFGAGGSRYIESLGPKPTQWRTRVEGVGVVVVSATQRGEVIEARFVTRNTVPTTPAQGKARAPSIPPAKGTKSVRPPRGDGPRAGGDPPGSRRKRPAAGAEHDAETPRVLDPARFDTPPLRHPRDDLDVDTPPPHATFAPPMGTPLGRQQMPTLPSEGEIDLDITAGEIPSVPQPMILMESLAGPASPRTLPESGYGPPARRTPSLREDPRPIAARAPTPPPMPAISPVAPAVRRATPVGLPPVAELTEPFAISSPRVATAAADGRPARTASGRTTRPFARDPHQSIFHKLLWAAREAGASDLHVVAGCAPLLRVGGQVAPRGEPLDAQLVEDMILSRVPSRLTATFERDGSCDFALDEPELGRFRVNVSRQRTGIKASLRLIAAEIPTLAGLGLPDAISSATRHHQGLIVISGPTGHGKTTTLAALVDILNRETTRHIITVEDPIEYVHGRRAALMSQREVGTHTRSFHTALKAALRQDPDVIVVGELRDTETVRIALSASETGHLVLGTMNTPSAARTIDRLIDLFPPGEQPQVRVTLAGGLRMIVSQRLLPEVDGRRMVAAAEVLPGMVPLWNLIRDNRTYQIPSLQQRGKGLGVIRLDDSLGDLVRAGRVAAAAAIAAAESPEELETTLGIRRPSQSMARAIPPPAGARPPDARPSEPQQPGPKGGFLERAGALFGSSGKKAP